MPLALIAIAAVALFALMRHPADPPGSMVSDVKAGHKYVLFLYAHPTLDQSGVMQQASAVLGGLFTFGNVQEMGPGAITWPDAAGNPVMNVAVTGWAVQVTATMNASAITIQDNLSHSQAVAYQALQAA